MSTETDTTDRARPNALETTLHAIEHPRSWESGWREQALAAAYDLARDVSAEGDMTLTEAVRALHVAIVENDHEARAKALAQAKGAAREIMGPRRRGGCRILTATAEWADTLEARIDAALEEGYLLQSFHCTGNAAASYGNTDDMGCETRDAVLIAVCVRPEHLAKR